MSRLERARQAQTLRAQGLTQREIGERLGVSRSYAAELLSDPSGAGAAARKLRYQGVCVGCGGPTYGGDGRAKAAHRCKACAHVPTSEHGTRSRYNRGCRCEPCRESQRLYMRSLKGRPVPTHSVSGYVNYGCRCSVCKAARARYLREYKRQAA